MFAQRLFSVRRLAGLLLLGALTTSAWGQQQQGPGLPAPQLLLVFPMGAKAGSTLDLIVTGPDLEDATALVFDLPGVKSELVGRVTAGPEMKRRRRQDGNQSTSVKFKVALPANATIGNHDVRVSTPFGVSNPRAFVIGDQKEVNEVEPNNDVPEAQRVDLNTTVNGVISTPTDVDYFVFSGKKGQRVVVSCLASSIDSRLQPEVQLYRRAGTAPLAVNRDYKNTDALTDLVLPADDDYYVRLCAFTYVQGGPDYFYRLSITTAPWIDAVFPPLVEPGKPTKVTVYGRNLPGGKPDPTAVQDGSVLEKVTLTLDVPKETPTKRLNFLGHVPPRSSGLNGFEYRLKNEAGASNAFLLTYAHAPVVLDNEANDTAATAQAVTLPCEIAGRIEKKGDRDWYKFNVKKGEVYSIDLIGDRLGSPLDLYYTLRSADARNAQEFDDDPDTLHQTQFYTRSDDPARQRFVAPADGTYLLQVSSREAGVQAGPRHLYGLRISAEQPDFNLIVMPASTNSLEGTTVRQGGAQYYTVFAWRQDGFRGDIALSVEGLPPGVTCAPQGLALGQKQGVLVVTAAADAPAWTGNLTVRGTATINGQKVERAARGASITWPVQQNNITVARLDQTIPLAVRDKAPCSLTVGLDKASVFAGDSVTIPVKLQRLWPDLKGTVQVSAVDLVGGGRQQQPFNFNNGQPLSLNPDKDSGSVSLTVRNNTQPGVYSVVLKATSTLPFAKDPASKNKQNVTITEVSTPVTITVVPKSLATLSVSPRNPNVQLGKDTTVTVKVTRQFDFPGEFTVELVAPDSAKGVTAERVTIAADKDEVTLTLKVAAGAAQGGHNLTVRATGKFGDKAIAQEARLTVNVTK